jgi:hypothetical protein
MIVPSGKTVYIGRRKFIEGQALPPFIRIDDSIPIMTQAEAEAVIEEIQKPTRKYTKKGLFGSDDKEGDE